MIRAENVRVALGERSYDIIFDGIDSEQVIAALAALPQKNVVIAADSNTAQYLDMAENSLKKAGKTVYRWIFPAGEASKNIDNAMALCAYASSLKLGRNALFAALGGGVTGDLTGFAASLFMRGVDFIQIPTSLLAMVDSSVGGKTAVDTAFGKNLVGAFHQPKLVVIDCRVLQTLPVREIGNGLAEIVKTAMILDEEFTGILSAMPADIAAAPEKIVSAVRRSCRIKASVVEKDEKESSDSGRVFLNYGHTFGHALEHLSCFRLAHGEAVATGMDIAAFAAGKLGLCDKNLREFQHRLLANFNIAPENFPLSAIRQDAGKVVDLMKGDKKNGDGRFRAVLPLAPGKVKTVDLDPEWTEKMLDEYFSSLLARDAGTGDDRIKVAIVGTGLLGSSLALSIDRRKYMVSLWNRNSEACRFLMDKQAADHICRDAEEAFSTADLVVLSLPTPVAEEFIRRYSRLMRKGAVLTDIASVKSGITACADSVEGLNFVGSHPMAGTEKSGYKAGFAGLFNNADVFIVPGKYATEDGIALTEEFWSSLNAFCRRITAAEHDKLVAHTSHMLHIIASALTRSILDRTDAREQSLNNYGCATGFRDTSRIASSSPAMWREICMENVSAILPALDEFRDCLWDLQKSLMDGDGERFTELFSLGKELRDSWLCYKKRDALPENIVLCGVKHCGKSSVGSAIASMWQIPLRDSDDEIVAADGGKRSVREIYIQEGEEYFRKLEAETVARMAADPIHGVIALGGGALSNPFLSAEVKKQLGFKVWLDVDDETAFERIKKNGLPEFLASENDPFGKLVRINADRRKVFAGDCDVKIIADKEAGRTAMQVLSACKEKFSL